jgi:putative peptidoglycan lipid II flippase
MATDVHAGRSEPPEERGRGVLRAARTVAGWTLASRILGLVRDVVSASRFGAGAVWDAFTIAWTFPNTFRRLLGEGALASAFIPTLTDVRAREGDEGAARLIDSVFTLLVLTLGTLAAVSLLLLLLIPPSAVEGVGNVEKLGLILRLLQVLMPYVILVCVTAFLGAVLQTFGHFAAPAGAPVLLNLFWIAALFTLCPMLGRAPSEQIFGVAIAILIGGVAQVAACLPPLARRGIRVRLTLRVRHPELGRLLRRMLPIVLGMAPTQLNILFDRVIAEAWVPGDGANSALYFGTRMMQFPLALVGVAMATAVLPTLAEHVARRDRAGLRSTLGTAVGVTHFVAAPAAIGLIVLAEPIVRFLFEHGRFSPEATQATARVIFGYAAGIPIICVVQVLTRAFYAEGDTRTPVRVAVVSMIANLIFNLILVGPLREAGLAWATTIAAGLNLALLALALRGRHGPWLDAAIVGRIVRVLALASGMGLLCVAVYTGLEWLRPPGSGLLFDGITAIVPVGVGVVSFAAGAAALRLPEYRDILGAVRRRK